MSGKAGQDRLRAEDIEREDRGGYDYGEETI